MTTGAEDPIRQVIRKCAGKAGCDVCRMHLEDDCLFFPELYRLCDGAEESGIPLTGKELKRLADLCTGCGLCPCPDIRMLIFESKARWAEEDGLPMAGKFISDIETMGRWATRLPRLVNRLTASRPIRTALNRALNIHPERRLPAFDGGSFFAWANQRGLCNPCNSNTRRKAAYFAGCSAAYLFPQVGRAAVRVLEQHGISVFVPPQGCCGMPSLMEGDRVSVQKKAAHNMAGLLDALDRGYDIVCSCPTCAYFFRRLMLENAYYSTAYQDSVPGNRDTLEVPAGEGAHSVIRVFRKTYGNILKDDGYFSSIDPLKRITLAQSMSDMGSYLASIRQGSTVEQPARSLDGTLVYYPPCHQRELGLGQPYYHLLRECSGATIKTVHGALDCCGMGGHLGFKSSFHPLSVQLGNPLFKKIINENPQALVTDCLSCRLQFQHNLPIRVFHPLELLDVDASDPVIP